MDKKQVLELAKSILEAVKKDPSQADVLKKTVDAMKKAAEPFHPGASRSEHQKQYDAKRQAESEAKLRTPEGEAQRVQGNADRLASMKKDDMPHPAGSPEDKAHDVKEEDESVKQALALLDTPEKQAAMLEHLRTLVDTSQERSPENQAVGQEPAAAADQAAPAPASDEMAAQDMDKNEMPKARTGYMKIMSKAEIKEELKKEWKPRFKKACK